MINRAYWEPDHTDKCWFTICDELSIEFKTWGDPDMPVEMIVHTFSGNGQPYSLGWNQKPHNAELIKRALEALGLVREELAAVVVKPEQPIKGIAGGWPQ